MGAYVDINGHQTWLDERGSGAETVLLLHGGVSNCDALLDTIGPALGERFRLVAFDRRGHGRTADTPEPFHYETMTDETVAVIERIGAPAHIVGWSDGGIIGLILGRRRPDLVSKMVLIGANFHHAGLMELDLDPESPVVAEMFAAYAERSPDGGDHFGPMMEKTLTMFATEPTMTVDDIREITAPTLVLVGDDDLITLAHTSELYEALPNGQLAVVPATSHALPMEKPAEVAHIIVDFLTADGVAETMMPARRAAKPASA
jgi:pimeloyl-ACP methyl ester carboxylesterase